MMREAVLSRRAARPLERGLTLIETMWALLLLSLMIVGVLGLLGNLLVASTKSTDTTAAAYIAQSVFQEAISTGPPADISVAQQGHKMMRSHEEEHEVRFDYEMTWTLTSAKEKYRLNGNDVDNQFGSNLYHVKVVVFWMVANANAGRDEGGGRRSVTFERLISYAPK